MNFYVPTIGDKIYLSNAWTFKLYAEYRNFSLMEVLGDNLPGAEPVPTAGSYSRKARLAGYATLPAGTCLRVDRIFIRGKARAYDSITFYIANSPNKKLANKKNGGTSGRLIRFWVKLEDANRIVCTLEPIADKEAPVVLTSRFEKVIDLE